MALGTVQIIGIRGMPLIKPGDDLAQIIVVRARMQGIRFRDDDILVIAQKAVSKAEGLLIGLSTVKPSSKARKLAARARKDLRLAEVILRCARKVLSVSGGSIVTESRAGLVCVNSGLDKSNVEGADNYSMLPEDPDAVAFKLMRRIRSLTGKRVMVVISDTYSRPFRLGQVDFAIGVAGFNPIVDYRGKRDLVGYRLKYKYVALADELAAAAELVMGQGKEGIPAAIIRGVTRIVRRANMGCRALLLSRGRDIFRGAL